MSNLKKQGFVFIYHKVTLSFDKPNNTLKVRNQYTRFRRWSVKKTKLKIVAGLRKVSEEPEAVASVSCGLTSSALDFAAYFGVNEWLTKASSEVVPAYSKLFLLGSPTNKPSMALGNQVCKPI